MKNLSGGWRAFGVNVLGVLLTVSMAGCVLDAASTGEPNKQPVDGEVASTAQDLLLSTTAVLWSQGDAPQFIHPDITNVACFLQSMSGKFKGMGEAVRVSRVEFADSSHPKPGWYVEGNSQQSGVHARARCISVPWVNWSWEFAWGPGLGSGPNGDVDLGIQKACFLTRIEGDFEGEGEQLRLVQACDLGNACRWTFTGKFASPGKIRGGAICINPPDMADVDHITEDVPVFQGTGNSSNTTLADRVPPDGSFVIGPPACFLTFVQGKFMGTGEEVWVNKKPHRISDGRLFWDYALGISEKSTRRGRWCSVRVLKR